MALNGFILTSNILNNMVGIEVKVMSFSKLETIWENDFPLLRAYALGYPKLYTDAMYWVLFVDGEAVGYTTARPLYSQDNFLLCILVGNTYIKKEWRSNGFHKTLLRERNSFWIDMMVPIIAIINPYEATPKHRLRSVVEDLGYEILEYDESEYPFNKMRYYDMISLKNKEMWVF